MTASVVNFIRAEKARARRIADEMCIAGRMSDYRTWLHIASEYEFTEKLYQTTGAGNAE